MGEFLHFQLLLWLLDSIRRDTEAEVKLTSSCVEVLQIHTCISAWKLMTLDLPHRAVGSPGRNLVHENLWLDQAHSLVFLRHISSTHEAESAHLNGRVIWVYSSSEVRGEAVGGVLCMYVVVYIMYMYVFCRFCVDVWMKQLCGTTYGHTWSITVPTSCVEENNSLCEFS